MHCVIQDKFGDGKGNCFAACLASLLELELHEVPNFCADEGNWYDATQKWLKKYGLWLLCVTPPEDGGYWPGYYIASGMGPRGIRHSVIYKDGELCHDPYPSGGGLNDVEYYEFLIPLIPPPIGRREE